MASDVRLWWVRTEAVSECWERWKGLLTAAEWERAGRFRVAAGRCRFIVCRALLRRVLAAELGIAPDRVQLAEGPYGKPVLAGEQAARRCSFNVAHAGGLGCVATSGGAALGVDVETSRRPMNLELMARKILTPPEHARFESLPTEQRLPAFLRLWTSKEALAKATGMGLRLPFSQIEIRWQQGCPTACLPGPVETDRFYLRELAAPEPGYFAALATQGPLRTLDQRWTDEAALVDPVWR